MATALKDEVAVDAGPTVGDVLAALSAQQDANRAAMIDLHAFLVRENARSAEMMAAAGLSPA